MLTESSTIGHWKLYMILQWRREKYFLQGTGRVT